LEGGAGADTFVFGRGRDVIEDFGFGADVIELSASLGVSSFDDVLARATTVDGGDDVLVDFGGGNTLRLEDVALASLTADHFVFG
ncbi:MAG: calcium-binding protein, partial [Pseudomonadota bacterium]